MALILYGKPIQKKIRSDVAIETALWRAKGISPRLEILYCQTDDSSVHYGQLLQQQGSAVGIEVGLHSMSLDSEEWEVLDQVEAWNEDDNVHAILPLDPFPPKVRKDVLGRAIHPKKDIEAINPVTLGDLFLGISRFVPSPVQAVLTLLDSYHVPIEGKHAVVLGRSTGIGRPLALLLLQRNATVTTCHTYTQSIETIARHADILVSAIGRPELVDVRFVKPGAVVIDVGTSFVDGKLVGDVCFGEVEKIASAVSPVPGGVGPVTTAVLLQSVLCALRWQRSNGND
ncbi:MAG: bifunctional 5,10-methylene-tetrahydrofolate dehydrogenase/5,10-methylene-tetrahydrofolate cyclohydrolase [Coprothermobacterota bacterium]|nr:bifunctional 5,10-methylene-tetrahydrofolate dehydrogenase/5,10-methylene-tetrahydrofolate cyclohydrolase [Coprothermobacterota bacterium]